MKTSLGIAVRNGRWALGLSQEEFAEKADLDRTYISDLERGTRNPSLESVAKLARALDLPVSRLLDPTQEHPATSQSADVLVVERDPRAARDIIEAFRAARLVNRIRVVGNAGEAFDLALKGQPALIVVGLDNRGAIKLLRTLQAHESTKRIPIALLSAAKLSCETTPFPERGAAARLAKPFSIQKFLEAAFELRLGWQLVKPSPKTTGEPAKEKPNGRLKKN